MTTEDLDATEIASMVRRRDATPRAFVEAAILRAEARNPSLNAIIHERYERALTDADALDPSTAPLAACKPS